MKVSNGIEWWAGGLYRGKAHQAEHREINVSQTQPWEAVSPKRE